jgi:hypothetical protein
VKDGLSYFLFLCHPGSNHVLHCFPFPLLVLYFPFSHAFIALLSKVYTIFALLSYVQVWRALWNPALAMTMASAWP